MQVIFMTAVGTPDVLELQNTLEPNINTPTEIKVKLYAAGVNPIDTKVRRNGVFYGNHLPAVLGCDGAGEVVAIGSAVTRFKVGDTVWFCHGGLGREQGNYAEFNVLDERFVSLMPSNFSFIAAAACPLVLITAWGALLDKGGLQKGQTVLIHAGAGGVGHVAIQLAKIKGAKVITTVSNSEKAEFVKSLGADEVVLYTEEDFAEAVNRLTDGKGADVVLDTVGVEVFKASIPATAYFGRLISLLDFSHLDLTEARLRNLLLGFELMLTPMLRDLHEARDKHIEILNQCRAYAEQGLLKVNVSHVLPLKYAAQAHTMIETQHTTGKIVLTI